MPDKPDLLSTRTRSLEAGSMTASPLIWPENSWRNHPAQRSNSTRYGTSAFLSRYRIRIKDEPFELNNDEPDTTYMLTMNLRSSDFDIRCGQFTLRTQQLARYDMWTTGPRHEPLRGVIKTSAEVFRVVFPESLVEECYEAVHDRRPPLNDGALIPTQFMRDKFVRRLFTSLYEVAASPAPYAEPLIESAGVVLARRLIALAATQSATPMREVRALTDKLLHLVNGYIEENLEGQIYLSDLSALVGLSRTHFAAQFKVATSSSPHSYILDRRIARAKELLVRRDSQIVDVALQSGFCNQAHFTKVFRRLTGKTPGQWRKDAN